MPHYDNPAGRLHELLTQLSEQNDDRESLVVAWAGVLSVPQGDLILHIGGVADLVRQIQEAVDRVGDEILRAPVRRLRETWARPIFPTDHAFNAELRAVLPGPESLESLGLVSAQLHLLAPEGKVPDGDELNELQQQVRDLIDEVRQSSELPDYVKDAIASRLMGVDKAIEHVHIGGPDAVRRAMEAVLGTVILADEPAKTAKTSAVQKVWVTIGVIWIAFNAGPKIQASIEAWPKIVHEVTSGEILDKADEPEKPAQGTNADEH